MADWFNIAALEQEDYPLEFGEYLLLGPLGTGGFAQVFRAEKCGAAGFRKSVAIKMIRQDVLRESQNKGAQELVWEARVGGLLKHRHIVDTMGFGIEEGQPFIAMEWVEGLSLKDLLALGAFPCAIACDIAIALAAALEYAHALRLGEDTICLVHRDVKPGNILVGWDGSVKLSDFGIAWLQHGASGIGEGSAGTPQYMSPEQAAGTAPHAASDLFSLGLVLYEMLAGAPLLSGELGEISQGRGDIEARLQDGLAALPKSAEPLHAAIQGCLRSTPEDRMDASTLLQTLKQIRGALTDTIDMDDWLADTFKQAEKSPGSTHTGTMSARSSDTFSFDNLEQDDGLSEVYEPLRAFGDRQEMVDAAFALEERVQQIPIGQRSNIREACIAAMAAGGWECARPGPGPALLIDPVKGQMWWGGEPIAKFRTKSMAFRLVLTIATRGEHLDRQTLFEEIWEQPYTPPASDNALYVRMHRTRDKFKDTTLSFEAGETYAYILNGKPPVYLWRGEPLEVQAPSPDEPESGPVLPHTPHPFFGRGQELTLLHLWFDSGGQICSLSGPPGIGKSRLAETFAREVAEKRTAWWCDLSDARSQGAIIGGIAEAIDVPLTAPDSTAGLSKRLGLSLGERGRGLLVLDACDEVTEVLADTLAEWLEHAPEIRFLLTGSRPLNLAAERRMVLRGFEVLDGVVDEDHPAVGLFVDRARQQDPTFAFTAENSGAVRQILRDVEGIPLAIALAAARVGQQTLEQIHRSLSSTETSQTANALRLALTAAWEKLAPYEKDALAQLTVFRGGFSMDFAEVVVDLNAWPDAPWPMDVISDLYDQSLLQASDGSAGPRFGMYKTIEQFARRHQTEEAALRTRHAKAYAEYATRYQETRVSQTGPWVSGLQEEVENLIHALEWRLQHPDGESAVPLGLAVATYFYAKGPYSAGLRYLSRLVRQKELTPEQTLRLRHQEQRLWVVSGRQNQAWESIEPLVAEAQTLGHPRLESQLRQIHMNLLKDRGQMDRALEEGDKALALAQTARHPKLQTRVLADIGTVQYRQSRFAEAEQTYLGALARAESHASPGIEAYCWLHLGNVSYYLGRQEEAYARYENALDGYRKSGGATRLALLSNNLGHLDVQKGEISQAEARFKTALAGFQKLGDRPNIALANASLGFLYKHQEDFEAAVQHYRRARELMKDSPHFSRQGRLNLELGAVLVAQGETEEAAEALRTGETLLRDSKNRAELTFGLTLLGQMALDQGHRAEAEGRLTEAEALVQSLELDAEAPIARGVAALRARYKGD